MTPIVDQVKLSFVMRHFHYTFSVTLSPYHISKHSILMGSKVHKGKHDSHVLYFFHKSQTVQKHLNTFLYPFLCILASVHLTPEALSKEHVMVWVQGGSVCFDDCLQFRLPLRHLLVVFGGLQGLEASVDADQKLDVTDPSLLFDLYLNTCPSQGSRTIRTEVCVCEMTTSSGVALKAGLTNDIDLLIQWVLIQTCRAWHQIGKCKWRHTMCAQLLGKLDF